MFVQTDITAEDFTENQCLLERWESLSSRVEEAQRANAIHRDIAAMHLEFRSAFDRIMAYEVVLEKPHILDERINQITVPDQKRHSRNCSNNKKGPGQYEEPDVVSSSDEEVEEEEVEQEIEQEVEQEIDDLNSRIIKAVRKRQYLWDNRLSKSTRTPTVMANNWIEVEAELGMEHGKAKKIWSTLRHKFSSERRKVEAGDESHWPYYTLLLFLIATRQPKQSNTVTTSQASTPKVVITNRLEPRKKKIPTNHQQIEQGIASNFQQIDETSTELVPFSKKRKQTRDNIQHHYLSDSADDSRKQELSVVSSDSDLDVVEEINMTNGSLLQRHIENPISFKRVCIRRMQETQLQNLDDDDDDDEIRRFCSYLEVMLRKMPKMHQEMFCEETLNHLASVNRKLRRSNF